MSPSGAFDMSGNIYQWNEGVMGLARSLRGGSFTSDSDGLMSSERNGRGRRRPRATPSDSAWHWSPNLQAWGWRCSVLWPWQGWLATVAHSNLIRQPKEGGPGTLHP